MGVAQKTTFSTLESLKKIFGVSGDLMEWNERGKPLKRLSSLINPKSASLLQLVVFIWKFAKLINSAACSFHFIVPLLKIFIFISRKWFRLRETCYSMVNAIILYLEIIILHTTVLQIHSYIIYNR